MANYGRNYYGNYGTSGVAESNVSSGTEPF